MASHEGQSRGVTSPADVTAEWASDVVLADGGTAHLRPVRPDDADTLVDLFGRLSQETILLRFFSMKRALTDQEIQRLTQVDYRSRMALVAFVGDQMVGLAGYDRLEGTDEAEVAFLVEDVQQGRGLGTLLLEHLAVIARQHGIRRFIAETYARNRKMLGVFQAAGFRVTSGIDEEDVAWVEFPIQPTEAAIAAIEERERRAEARSMARLLAPRSIALIGLEGKNAELGRELLRKLIEDFAGSVYPVHPSARHVAAVHAYPSVLDVPEDVDLAIVLAAPAAVAELVGECAQKRTRGLVVVTPALVDGEAGPAGQRAVVALARRHGMRLVGPGSLGVINTAESLGMYAAIGAAKVPRGPLGCLSQSGALGVAMLERAASLGLGVSTFVSTGMQADVTSVELLQYWEGDADTDAVLLYLESFGNPRTFARVARRVSRTKPIVAVQSGRSRTQAGARGPSADGAATRDPEVAVDALFRQAGIIRVDTLEQMFDVAQLLVTAQLPAGRRVAVVSNSNGLGNLGADACEGAGLLVPELSAETQARLRVTLSAPDVVRNPVDLSFSAPAVDYEHAIAAMLADGGLDALLVLFSPASHTATIEDVEQAITRAGGDDCAVPIVASFLGRPPNGRRPFPVFAYPEAAAQALARAGVYVAWRRRRAGVVPVFDDISADPARLIVDAALAAHPTGVELASGPAITLLSHYGIGVIPAVWAGSADEAAEAADSLGYPVALKAGSPRLVHRRDLGGVRVGLSSASDVRAAYVAMEASLGAGLDGVLVQQMVPAGVETTVGVIQDPSFGPLVSFGIAGVEAELLGDRGFRILPLTDVDARELVTSVKGAPLLFGYRGAPIANVAALEQLLLRTGRLVEDIPEIAELDLTPVIVNADGAIPVNARVRLVPARPQPELPYRRLD